jgi:hypothetical protein
LQSGEEAKGVLLLGIAHVPEIFVRGQSNVAPSKQNKINRNNFFLKKIVGTPMN